MELVGCRKGRHSTGCLQRLKLLLILGQPGLFLPSPLSPPGPPLLCNVSVNSVVSSRWAGFGKGGILVLCWALNPGTHTEKVSKALALGEQV